MVGYSRPRGLAGEHGAPQANDRYLRRWANKTSQTFDGYLPLTGGDLTGVVTVTTSSAGPHTLKVKSDTDAQIRLTRNATPTQSVILRNDGSSFYFLISDTEDGTWNTLRPFSFGLSSGDVTMNGNVSVGNLQNKGAYYYFDYDADTTTYLSGSLAAGYIRHVIGAVERFRVSSAGVLSNFASIGQTLLPSADLTYNLGSGTQSWNAVFSAAQYDENNTACADWNTRTLMNGNWTIQGDVTLTGNGLYFNSETLTKIESATASYIGTYVASTWRLVVYSTVNDNRVNIKLNGAGVGVQYTNLPTYNNANGSMRWMGLNTNEGQAHTSSSLAYKHSVAPIRTKGRTPLETTGAIFDRLDPIFFRYVDDHPHRDRWKGRRPRADKAAEHAALEARLRENPALGEPPSADDDEWFEDVDYWEGFENAQIGRMGFAYEQVQDVAPHWTYVADGMEAVSYEGMLPDFMGWSVATIRDLRDRIDVLEAKVGA